MSHRVLECLGLEVTRQTHSERVRGWSQASWNYRRFTLVTAAEKT